MPQMSPMLWISLYLYFLMLFLFIIILLYYLILFNEFKLNKIKLMKFNFLNKW